MPKRSSKKPKKREDEAQAAVRVIATIAERSEEDAPREKNPAAVALGRLGGLKGGKARDAKLTDEEKVRIAKMGAAARWKKSE